MAYRFPDSWSRLRVALSHDWLTGMRGGERCLELLCEGFPKAPIFTLLHNPDAISLAINRHAITPSFLQRVPGIIQHYRYLLPVFPWAIRSFQPPDADVLISTSHCVAKALPTLPGTKHLCYCFTPMRYAWTFHGEYFASGAKRALAAPLLAALRVWDRRTAGQVHQFVAISEHVRDRIKKFYDRESDVVYPPVNTGFYTPGGFPLDGSPDARKTQAGATAHGTQAGTSARKTQAGVTAHGTQAGTSVGHPDPGSFDLIVSALVPYKRLDLAVRAYTRLGFPLKIVGAGTERAALRKIAGPVVEFLGWQHDNIVRDLYRRCRLLVFPGEEDFGIVPLEAQSCGRPVVAFARGGALETIVDGQTGVFFQEQTEGALLAAVETCASQRWNAEAIRRNAERFSIQNFIDGVDVAIRKCLGGNG